MEPKRPESYIRTALVNSVHGATAVLQTPPKSDASITSRVARRLWVGAWGHYVTLVRVDSLTRQQTTTNPLIACANDDDIQRANL